MQKVPGKNFIFVPGILCIIFSGLVLFAYSSMIRGLLSPSSNLSTVGGLGVQDGVPVFYNGFETQAIPAAMAGFVITAIVVMVVVNIINLIIGIIAVLNANKPQKSKTVIALSFLLIALAVLSFIIALISAFTAGRSILIDLIIAVSSLAIALILPILIMIGGKKNQAYAKSSPQG